MAYASAGAGHFKAAEALYNCFKEKHKDVDIRLIDILDDTSSFFRLSYTRGYTFLIHYAVFLWKIAFWITEVKSLRGATRGIARLLNRSNTGKYIDILCKENPDILVSTHFLSSEIAANLKQDKKISSCVITVITDYGVHPFWISEGTDEYIVASDHSKQLLENEGIPAAKIRPLGIPVHAKFLKAQDKEALIRKLGVKKNMFTVLLITGSFGLGHMDTVVEYLKSDVQLIVVCANNKQLYKKLSEKKYPNCIVCGFVDNIQELMAVSDMIITKPGGLTISEVLAMGIVPVFISAIPGQEVGNVRELEKFGIGTSPEDMQKLKEIVLAYKDNPGMLEKARERIAAFRKKDAAQEICNAICKDCLRPAG